MDLNLITIARRASLGPRIVKTYENTIHQINGVEGQYNKIAKADIFDANELLFNRKISLIGIVSLLEQYLFSIHHEILQSFPKKLGNDKFDIDEVLEEGGLLPIISKKATKKVLDVAYGSFNKQIDKIVSAFDIKAVIDPDTIEHVNEIKCSRDVYAHSPDSKVNMIYLQKAGSKSRQREGTVLIIDEKYFKESIVWIKKLLEDLFNNIPKKFKDSNALHVFRQMWENSCLRLPFETVWEIDGEMPFPLDFENDYGFSSSEMEVYNLFRYIYGRRQNHKPDFANYFARWKPKSKEAQLAYSWLDCQFYF